MRKTTAKKTMPSVSVPEKTLRIACGLHAEGLPPGADYRKFHKLSGGEHPLEHKVVEYAPDGSIAGYIDHSDA